MPKFSQHVSTFPLSWGPQHLDSKTLLNHAADRFSCQLHDGRPRGPTSTKRLCIERFYVNEIRICWRSTENPQKLLDLKTCLTLPSLFFSISWMLYSRTNAKTSVLCAFALTAILEFVSLKLTNSRISCSSGGVRGTLQPSSLMRPFSGKQAKKQGCFSWFLKSWPFWKFKDFIQQRLKVWREGKRKHMLTHRERERKMLANQIQIIRRLHSSCVRVNLQK